MDFFVIVVFSCALLFMSGANDTVQSCNISEAFHIASALRSTPDEVRKSGIAGIDAVLPLYRIGNRDSCAVNRDGIPSTVPFGFVVLKRTPLLTVKNRPKYCNSTLEVDLATAECFQRIAAAGLCFSTESETHGRWLDESSEIFKEFVKGPPFTSGGSQV